MALLYTMDLVPLEKPSYIVGPSLAGGLGSRRVAIHWYVVYFLKSNQINL
jgi:hypothetical protein